MEKIENVFVVHWDKLQYRKDRLDPILKQTFGDKYQWRSFFDRDTIKEEHYKDWMDPNHEHKMCNICIAMEQICIYQDIVNNQLPISLILEDDAVIHNDFKEKMTVILSEAPKDWDIIFIGTAVGKPSQFTRDSAEVYVKNILTEKNTLHLLNDYIKEDKFAWLHGEQWLTYAVKKTDHLYLMPHSRCTDSYLISLKGAVNLLQQSAPIKTPMDAYMSETLQRANMNVYWMEDGIVTQASKIEGMDKRCY